ncbi:MAG: efflux RND transporter periplasmic adaptor subunit [Candidatus Hydrogenedentes bacterium]|nr:efflux RND transporter periplasmic adaptor subunit [Candidatus Hydrogenedentota bacterium]
MSAPKHKLDELRIDRTAPRPSRLPWVLLMLLVLGGGAAAGVKWWQDNQVKAVAVRTALVRESTTGGDRTLLNSSGYVTARREATVSSKVTGKVTEVLVEEGMQVEEGQVLARIDPSNTEMSLKLAEAQLGSAQKALQETRVRLAQAERDRKRSSELVTDGVASQSDLDQTATEAASLKAQLERQRADIAVAEREVALWQQQIDDMVIRAPFTGVVTAKNAQPGEMLSLMSGGGGFARTGICTIVDMKSLEIEVDVSESYINRVTADQPVVATLDSYPDWKIPARVIAIIPTADRQKATVKVRVAFEELDARILPEMSVKVAFQNAETEQPLERLLLAPKAAIRERDGKEFVWVVREGRVVPRPIAAGEAQGDEVVVITGLAPGEQVVVEGPDDLADGASVTEKVQ